MRIRWVVAFVSALAAAAMTARGDRTDMAPPVRVTLDLPLRGETIDGLVIAWDDRVLWVRPRTPGATEDDAAQIAWTDVDAAQSYKLRTRIMDKSSASAWLLAAILMLDVGDVDRAERAMAQAVRIDASMRPLTRTIVEAHANGADARALVPGIAPPPGAPPDAEGSPGKPEPPEDSAPRNRSEPWPELTPEDRAEITAGLRIAAGELVKASGLTRIKEIETEYFLFYSDLAPSEVKRWSGVLDTMYRTLVKTLEMPKGALLFHGKCVIFIFNSRADFLTFEDKAMGYDAARAGGVCHRRGPDTVVVFYRGADDARFQSVLVHETVHAFMHRYRSPAELPTWANEGLADYVAGVLTPMSSEPRDHWMHAKQFAQMGKDAAVIMRQNYLDGSWYTEDSYPISHMIVRFMLMHKPRAFKEWIDDIKAGEDWNASMQQRFGVTAEMVAKGFVDAMRSEKKFTPAR